MNAADKLIVEHLAKPMEERGFKYQKSHVGFVQKRDFGFVRLACHSSLIGHLGGFQLQVGLAVRHDRVDNIVDRLGHIWGEANQKKTTTVYRGLGFFPFDADLSEDVVRSDRLDADAASASSRIKSMMDRHGDAFFERYSSLLECSRGLNDPIETRTYSLLNAYPQRAYYGIAAAGLAEPTRVPELVEAYTAFSRESGWADPLTYDVGHGAPAADAIQLRFKTIAEMAVAELQSQP